MPRRRSANPRKSKFDWTGNSYPKYNPQVEGYGSPAEWASTFNVCMGFKEAQAHKAHGTRRASWGSDWTVLGEIAGVHVDENSMWSEIKGAFRKAAMNCHPDRVSQHGMDKDAAEAMFKDASAAYAMLEDIYRSKGRIE